MHVSYSWPSDWTKLADFFLEETHVFFLFKSDFLKIPVAMPGTSASII